jgi:hypothetical protein
MILYKYLSPDRIDVLENLRIRFTQPLYLNDPYETNPVVTGSETTQEQWEKIGRIECERNGMNYDDFKQLEDPKVREKLFPDSLQIMKALFNHITGILSLSETHDNVLMWSHYCLNHTGFVIQFYCDHPFFKSAQKDYVIDSLSKVDYLFERPTASLENLTMRDWYFAKSNFWSYEKEWRILKTIEKAETKLSNGEISLFNIPKEVIKCVYIGAACSEEQEEKIIKFVDKNELNCHLNKMVLNPRNYKIDAIDLKDWLKL